MQRYGIIAVMIAFITVYACGGGGGGDGDGSSSSEGKNKPGNKPPVAEAGQDQTVVVGDTVYLDGSGSTDPDDDIVSYTWIQTKGPAITLSDASAYISKFIASVPENSQLSFELTVKDKVGQIAKDSCTITVKKRTKNAPIAHAGYDQTVKKGNQVTLDGSGSLDADNNIKSYRWVQKSGPSVALINPDRNKASFETTALPDNSLLNFELTVTDADNLSDNDTCAVAVVTLGNVETQNEAQDVLYAVYAGIGYMNADDANDDEHLYDIMVGDLNMVVYEIVHDTIINDPYMYINLLALYWNGKADFSYDNGYYAAKLHLENGNKLDDLNEFVGTLRVDFTMEYKPSLGHCTYWGYGTNDLSAVINGSYKLSLLPQDQEIYFKSVSITANPTLRAAYQDDIHPQYTAAYNTWNISHRIYYGQDDPLYQVAQSPDAINMYLLPPDYRPQLFSADFRDYTIDGSFSVNGTTSYTFSKGFHYIQKQLDINGKTYVMIAVDGVLSIPNRQGFVLISSPKDFENPEHLLDPSKDTISKIFVPGNFDNGIWAIGNMTLSGENTAVYVNFNHGKATFTGDLGSWLVDNWQDILDPIH